MPATRTTPTDLSDHGLDTGAFPLEVSPPGAWHRSFWSGIKVLAMCIFSKGIVMLSAPLTNACHSITQGNARLVFFIFGTHAHNITLVYRWLFLLICFLMGRTFSTSKLCSGLFDSIENVKHKIQDKKGNPSD